MKSYVPILFGGIFLSAAVLVFVAGFFALEPKRLINAHEEPPKQDIVKLKEIPKVEEPPPPENKANTDPASSLASLAPESMTNAFPDLGAGVGFGSGGGGPGVAGGGGFGAETTNLVREQGAVNRPARAVARSQPEYPAEAKKKNVSGFVVLKILVGKNGLLEDVKVEASEPTGFFDQAAMRAVRAWRFEPAVVKGQTAAAWIVQRIKFELN